MNIEKEIIELREAVARIEAKLDSQVFCSNPNLCLVLEPRIRALESAEDKRKGGWIYLSAMLMGASTFGGLVAAWVRYIILPPK